jgi:uncharacterized protein YjiS (DUF1127 family)
LHDNATHRLALQLAGTGRNWQKCRSVNFRRVSSESFHPEHLTMSQIQTFSLTTARRPPAPMARRAANFPEKASSGVPLRAVAFLRNLQGRLRRAQERSAERKALQSLLTASDHILSDIGIGRHELVEMIQSLDA